MLGHVKKVAWNDFKWVEDISELNQSFIKSCNEESNEGHFLEVDIQNIYITFKVKKKNLNLLFLPERMKIEKVEKLLANLHNKNEYVIHIIILINLKQALNHRLVLKKLHTVIKFNLKS